MTVVIKGVDFVKGAPFGLACGDEFLDGLEFNVNKMRGCTRATQQDHSSLPHSLSHSPCRDYVSPQAFQTTRHGQT